MRIQPDEGISLRFGAKVPGPEMHIRQVQMNFSYTDAFKVEPATAYETLLLDAMQGDPTLFNRADAVETAWTVLEPLLDIWHATKPFQPFPNYGAGTWGPAAADALLARDGRAWRNPTAVPPPIAHSTVHLEHGGEPMGASRSRPGDGQGNGKTGDGKTPEREGRSLA
jgi:glucose-6-phosphate 1-dehydrogenase